LSIKKAIRRAKDKVVSKHLRENKKENCGKVYLPFIQGITDKIAKFLRKNNINTQFTTCGTIRQMMRSVKDNINRQNLKVVYKIDCSCGKSYIGETGRSLKIRLKEHEADIKNERSRTSALAEHSSKTKHHVCLEDAKIIAREDNYQKRKIKEAIEIMKFPQNLNRDNGSEISGNWLPLIRQINPSKPLEA
jgi:predicted GIY-YIG superfamily endonuclease